MLIHKHLTVITVKIHLRNAYIQTLNSYNSNKIYREKSIPMTALWCPAFSYHG